MKKLCDFFSRHPLFATALHVTLSVGPLALLLLFIAVVAVILVAGLDFYEAVPYIFIVIMAICAVLGCSGLFLLLALLLYRFTEKARANWPDRLRMALIRLNIFNGFMAFGSLLFWIWYGMSVK